MKEDIKPMVEMSDYKYYLTLEPLSIQFYNFYVTKEEISEVTGLQFAQIFTYVKPEQYDEILKIANRQIANPN